MSACWPAGSGPSCRGAAIVVGDLQLGQVDVPRGEGAELVMAAGSTIQGKRGNSS
ncbi:hypothetical protein GUJ93_ZPchr0010g11024 [Zizania palustris]|uniref:Uncharacterized protein n=1 Tax=Zizania palustris TaxID=103762 RepID=A0A8J5W922_ZIZPA|nr:hypothetical protein GUJ93_ZPchr0010g11024 [Zizania palustris]